MQLPAPHHLGCHHPLHPLWRLLKQQTIVDHTRSMHHPAQRRNRLAGRQQPLDLDRLPQVCLHHRHPHAHLLQRLDRPAGLCSRPPPTAGQHKLTRATVGQPPGHLQPQPTQPPRHQIAGLRIQQRQRLHRLAVTHQPRHPSLSPTQQHLVLTVSQPDFFKQRLRTFLPRQVNTGTRQLGLLPVQRAPNPPQRRLPHLCRIWPRCLSCHPPQPGCLPTLQQHLDQLQRFHAQLDRRSRHSQQITLLQIQPPQKNHPTQFVRLPHQKLPKPLWIGAADRANPQQTALPLRFQVRRQRLSLPLPICQDPPMAWLGHPPRVAGPARWLPRQRIEPVQPALLTQQKLTAGPAQGEIDQLCHHLPRIVEERQVDRMAARSAGPPLNMAPQTRLATLPVKHQPLQAEWQIGFRLLPRQQTAGHPQRSVQQHRVQPVAARIRLHWLGQHNLPQGFVVPHEKRR